MTDELILHRITGWRCERDGLAFADEKAAQAHVTKEGCRWGYTRPKTLAELQTQMDVEVARVERLDGELSVARSRIAQASSDHRKVREQHDAAKERREAARLLWAARARHEANGILGPERKRKVPA